MCTAPLSSQVHSCHFLIFTVSLLSLPFSFSVLFILTFFFLLYHLPSPTISSSPPRVSLRTSHFSSSVSQQFYPPLFCLHPFSVSTSTSLSFCSARSLLLENIPEKCNMHLNISNRPLK